MAKDHTSPSMVYTERVSPSNDVHLYAARRTPHRKRNSNDTCVVGVAQGTREEYKCVEGNTMKMNTKAGQEQETA